MSAVPDLQAFVGGDFGPFPAWDAVNAPMIRQWCEVMGEGNPIHTDPEAARQAGFSDIVAPPSMLMVWTMTGYGGKRPPGAGTGSAMAVLDVLREAGFPGIVAVNCEQDYLRYLEVGDSVYFRSTCESISGQKQTGLGAGYFVTELSTFYNQRDEVVGTQRFRVLCYQPREGEA